jgi:TolB-like protein
MTPRNNDVREHEPADTGAGWFVELDRGSLDPARDRELVSWLERDPEHAAELARCEAAVQLTRELQGDVELRWAFAEAARLAEAPPPFLRVSWYRRPALAWGVTAVAVVVAVAVSLGRWPVVDEAPPPASARNVVPAELVRELAAAKPVVLAPDTANLVVDARSVAVLPFERELLAPGDDSASASAAATLYDTVMRDLAAIPGVYVLERAAVIPYAERGIAPDEMAMQLSVRGVVSAQVAAADGRVRVVLWIVDAAQGGPASEQVFERPTRDLGALNVDIVTHIAATLATPVGGREPAAINEE